MQSTTVNSNRQRPLGVSVLAIIVALQGIGLLIIEGGFVNLLAAFVRDGMPIADALFVGLFTTALVLIGAILLVVGWGLWTLKPWAFSFTIVAQVLSIVSSLGLLAQTGNATTTSTTSNVVLALIILIYLLADRNVRAAFRT